MRPILVLTITLAVFAPALDAETHKFKPERSEGSPVPQLRACREAPAHVTRSKRYVVAVAPEIPRCARDKLKSR